MTSHRDLALFHIHVEVPSVLYTYMEICVPTPNFVACLISVYDTLKFATKPLFLNVTTAPLGQGFTILLRNTTLGRTPLNEWSARRRDLYLTTHNTHKREPFIPLAEFEPAIPASERPQTNAVDREATGIGWNRITFRNLFSLLSMMITLRVSAYGIGKYTGERVVQQLAVSHTGVTERGEVAGKNWEYYITFRCMW